MYRSLTSSKDHVIADELEDGAADDLNLNEVITENTIGSTSEKVEAQIGPDVSSRLRETIEQLEENDEIVRLPAR